MAVFALATGLRRANVTGLQWSQVDFRRLAWVHPDQAKARRAISVPLGMPMAVLIIRKQMGKHPTHVFSFDGTPITQASTKAWYKGWKRRGSKISAGTTCGILGQGGMCTTARRCFPCKSWAAGKARRWCGRMRISRLTIWPVCGSPLRTEGGFFGECAIDCIHSMARYGTGLEMEKG